MASQRSQKRTAKEQRKGNSEKWERNDNKKKGKSENKDNTHEGNIETMMVEKAEKDARDTFHETEMAVGQAEIKGTPQSRVDGKP